MKKKILWMTNVRFSQSNIKSTGTWLQPLAEEISRNGNFELYHVALENTEDLICERIGEISQYLVPSKDIKIKDNLATSDSVKKIINDVNPDIIHIWGTESVWFLMNRTGIFLNHLVLLDMQGVLKSCYESYYGGLGLLEQLQCIGLKELLKPSSSIWFVRNIFKKKALVEEQNLKSYEYISYQSQWVKNRLNEFGLRARLYSTKIILRDDFYCHRWKPCGNVSPVLFTITSSAVPYKGLHILIKACSIIRRKYPDFILNIIGGLFQGKYNIKTGYEIYLLRLIRKYGLTSNIRFCGSMSSSEIVQLQMKSDLSVVPSFVESYCLGMAEAMMVGMPVVAAYSAALPTIADDKIEALFYSPMDYIDCAEKIINVFEDKELALYLSSNAMKRRVQENGVENVVNTQISIYEEIIASHKHKH